MYSEKADFKELLAELVCHHADATVDEINVAIEAVVKIEEEFQALVYSKYDIRDKDVIKRFINEGLAELREIEAADSHELASLLKQQAALKAERADNVMRMAFTLERMESEDSFTGAVYKAKKIKNGPITIEQRRTFKRLTEQLQDANERMTMLDEEISARTEEESAT